MENSSHFIHIQINQKLTQHEEMQNFTGRTNCQLSEVSKVERWSHMFSQPKYAGGNGAKEILNG